MWKAFASSCGFQGRLWKHFSSADICLLFVLGVCGKWRLMVQHKNVTFVCVNADMFPSKLFKSRLKTNKKKKTILTFSCKSLKTAQRYITDQYGRAGWVCWCRGVSDALGSDPGGENDLFIKGTTRRSKAGKGPSAVTLPDKLARVQRSRGQSRFQGPKTHRRETQQEVRRETDTEKQHAGENRHCERNFPPDCYCQTSRVLPAETGSSTSISLLLFSFQLLSVSVVAEPAVVLPLSPQRKLTWSCYITTDRAKRIQRGAFQDGS